MSHRVPLRLSRGDRRRLARLLAQILDERERRSAPADEPAPEPESDPPPLRPVRDVRIDGCQVWHGGRHVWVTGQQADIVAALHRAPGHYLTHAALADALYGADPDGGPAGADQVIKVHVSTMRPTLAAIGMAIVTHWGRGYQLAARAAGSMAA